MRCPRSPFCAGHVEPPGWHFAHTPLLRSALAKYRLAILALSAGRLRQFRSLLPEADRDFSSALRRQQRAGQLLDEVIAADATEADFIRNSVWESAIIHLEHNRQPIDEAIGL